MIIKSLIMFATQYIKPQKNLCHLGSHQNSLVEAPCHLVVWLFLLRDTCLIAPEVSMPRTKIAGFNWASSPNWSKEQVTPPTSNDPEALLYQHERWSTWPVNETKRVGPNVKTWSGQCLDDWFSISFSLICNSNMPVFSIVHGCTSRWQRPLS